VVLSWNRYGKSRIRLVKVDRSSEPHRLIDLTVDVQLEGAFERVYTDGDNAACLPTDTMKNTVYALARRQPIDSVEAFLARLADHFAAKPGVSLARVGATEQPWARLANHAFVHASAEQWTAAATRLGGALEIVSGVTNLVLLKTTDSAFAGFPRDEFTTLPETHDRILATAVTAAWRYRPGTTDFAVRDRIRAALVDTFAGHRSESVQHTLDAMGRAALAAAPDAVEITLTLPNRHHLLVDLTPFGLENPNEIFVATDQPFGLIEATLRRQA
jgi:urate oxidase